MELNR